MISSIFILFLLDFIDTSARLCCFYRDGGGLSPRISVRAVAASAVCNRRRTKAPQTRRMYREPLFANKECESRLHRVSLLALLSALWIVRVPPRGPGLDTVDRQSRCVEHAVVTASAHDYADGCREGS